MEVLTEQSTTREAVRDFISRSVNIGDIDDAEDLFDSGIVNSLFSIQLVTFIERQFKVSVGLDDLDIANFKSVDAIEAFVQRKKPQL